MDVFGGLGGTGSEPGRATSHGHAGDGTPVDPSHLEPVLDGAALWGMELDTSYRVMAVTLEPAADRYPWGSAADRRIQVLAFPVSTILVTLRSSPGGEQTIHAFDQDQLVEVAAAFGGATVTAPLFGQPEPRPGEWGPRFSLEGRSSAPDGTAGTLRLEVRSDDLDLRVFARFDELRVRDPAGQNLDLPV